MLGFLSCDAHNISRDNRPVDGSVLLPIVGTNPASYGQSYLKHQEFDGVVWDAVSGQFGEVLVGLRLALCWCSATARLGQLLQ